MYAGSPRRPSTALPGIRRTGLVVEAGDVAALLVDRDDRIRVGGVDRVGQLAQLRQRGDVRAEDAHPAEAVAQTRLQPVGQRRPHETGKQGRRDLAAEAGPLVRRESGVCVRCRRRCEPAHPFTAPLTSPLVIRPCTKRKKMMTGTATRVDAAMTWPQSVARDARLLDEPAQPERKRLAGVLLQDDQRDRELVPRLEERVHTGCDEPGSEQRERDAHERLRAAEAVDHRRLFEVGRDAGDEAAQHPDRERHDGGDVDDAHADDRVQEVRGCPSACTGR